MTDEQLIEKTRQLITIPSTADNAAALKQAVDAIADMLKNCQNVTIERFEQHDKPSFLAYRGTVRPTEFDILLNAHVDVVPADSEAFKPHVKGGKLFGRGSLDMKGTAVVLASIFSEMVNTVPYALGLQIVSDEEVGGYDGVRHQIDQGVRSKFVIMGEYANDRNTIYNAARGLCWAEIVFRGKAAHGGHLWNGVNAVLKAGEFAGAILKRYPTPEKETWTTTASIANLTTPNETYNKVPDTAVLKIDFRFTQEDPVFENEESIKKFISSIDPDAELVNLAVFEPAVNVEELNPYVQGLSAAMHSVTGTKAHFLGRPASSDGRHFALVKNDIIEFGLYGHNPHSDNEYVELTSFGEYRAILKKFLSSPLGVIATTPKPAEPLHLSLLRQLVAMPTESGNSFTNNKALLFIERFLKTRGMYVERFEHNSFGSLFATTKRGNKKPTVLLSAHIDVVPASPSQFKLTSKGDRLYGRGVMDMKFAIASYLSLVDTLKDNLAAYDFGIMITSDEEIGGRNGTNILVNKEGIRPKVAIVPDGGENWHIETFAKSVQWIKLEANGVSAHASRPWEGKSAIGTLLAALHDIRELIPENPSREATSLTVSTIEGGEAGNKVPAYASTLLDIRCGSVADFKRIPHDINTVCKKYDIQATYLTNDPPHINDMRHPLVALFRTITKHTIGTEPPASFSYGTTDGRYFSAHDIPSIITTPESGGRHTDNEWLSKAGFDQFTTVLERYIKEAASQLPTVVKHPKMAKQPAYVWHATYGTGLSKEIYLAYIHGGQPKESTVNFPGCTDKSLPRKDMFMSLPHKLYFAGESPVWGGGYVNINPERDPQAHTISRAYLITLEQFEEIVAQHNHRKVSQKLPLVEAKQLGHATQGDGTGDYDELIYCGEKDGWPIYTITATVPRLPYKPPSLTYARLLYKGLSEQRGMLTQKAIDYIFTKPGATGHYHEGELAQLLLGQDTEMLRNKK